MTKGWATAALVVIAVALIGVGLLLTGGPDQARKERRDQEREDDLGSLASLVDCLASANGGRLPDRLAQTSDCDWQARLADPFTNQPYRYERITERSYQLCATFETPPPKTRGPWGRDENGCVSRQYIRSPQSGGPVVRTPPR